MGSEALEAMGGGGVEGAGAVHVCSIYGELEVTVTGGRNRAGLGRRAWAGRDIGSSMD